MPTENWSIGTVDLSLIAMFSVTDFSNGDNCADSAEEVLQRQEVQQLITKEADIFSVIDSGTGNITSTQMEIKLKEKTPFQFNYRSVLKPLYAELK